MEASEFIQTLETLHTESRRRGLYFQKCQELREFGRIVVIDGQPLKWFGSCSYLGLEGHPDVLAAAHEALDHWGSQFSTSRGYLSAQPYEELEELLSQVFGAHVVVGPTTTLSHMAAFDALISEHDAVVLDHQVHNSVYRAATVARARGTTVKTVRHERLERAIEEVEKLSRKHRRVYFSTDGVYSMYGDLAPFDLLNALLEIGPNVRLYIDDAHGMSWAGMHGRGKFLSVMELDERVILATSLAKSFAACGGVLAFRSKEECERVRMCGGPMLFSGPVQPATVAAAVAVAKIHLSEGIQHRQALLQERVMLFNKRLIKEGLPLLVENDTPIFFIRMGMPKVAFEVAERLRKDGMFVNVSMYPAVPMKRAGLRITLNNNLTLQDINELVDALKRHVPAVLAVEGLSRNDIDDLFRASVVGYTKIQIASTRLTELITVSESIIPKPDSQDGLEADPRDFVLQTSTTIEELDADEWNSMLGHTATCSWDSLRMQEQLFRKQPQKEHNWDFHYCIVRKQDGTPVCATFLTVAIGKDDMLMRHEVSKEVELRRVSDPYFLTSLAVTFGSSLSEGNHLYIDREGPWRAGLTRLLRWAMTIFEKSGANQLVVRDMPGEDPELDQLFLSDGFIKVPMLDSHLLDVDWEDDDGLVARGPSNRARRYLKRMRENSKNFIMRVYQGGTSDQHDLSDDAIEHLHQLYLNVATRNYRINIFTLPENMLHSMLKSPAWEVVTLSLAEGGPPVGWFAGHRHDKHYAALCCGLDYEANREHSAYRQILYQIATRARACNASILRLGMTADVEKHRFGTRIDKTCLYISATPSQNSTILREIVTRLGVSAGQKKQLIPRAAPG